MHWNDKDTSKCINNLTLRYVLEHISYITCLYTLECMTGSGVLSHSSFSTFTFSDLRFEYFSHFQTVEFIWWTHKFTPRDLKQEPEDLAGDEIAPKTLAPSLSYEAPGVFWVKIHNACFYQDECLCMKIDLRNTIITVGVPLSVCGPAVTYCWLETPWILIGQQGNNRGASYSTTAKDNYYSLRNSQNKNIMILYLPKQTAKLGQSYELVLIE